MGNRSNVVVLPTYRDDKTKSGDKRVYLYSHWKGEDVYADARNALARRQRWDDDSYLARMIFCKMVGADHGETGFGISSTLGDNNIGMLLCVVDCAQQVVRFHEEKDNPALDSPVCSFTFEEYATLTSGGKTDAKIIRDAIKARRAG